MENTTRLLLPEVTQALKSNPAEILPLTEEMHPADLADLAQELEPGLAQELLRILPDEVAADLLEACEEEVRLTLFADVATRAIGDAVSITDHMAADDRADLYAELDDELRKQLLEAIDEEDSRDIRQLLSYPEDTAGALLTTDFVALPADTTAADAIERVRTNAAEMETIYQAYAVDPHGTLLGVVSLRDLVTSPADRTIDEIMSPNIVSINVEDDQEEAARIISKYDLMALPVVDRSHHIVGIITFDDVLDVVEEEATEDVHKLGAIEPLEQPYLTTPFWELIRARAPWLVALFIATLATENVLEHYAYAGPAVATLMYFVPVIVSSGGNSGSQSATLIIRAMAVGRARPRDTAKIIRRELLVGVVLGIIVGGVGIGRTLVTESTRSIEFAMAIGCSLLAVVTMGALLGSGVPLLLRRLGIDPAVSSTPFIASMLDVTGLVMYFTIAGLFLG
jgi:magnesium transporter